MAFDLNLVFNGYRKDFGRIFVSTQPCLLKYSLSTLSQIYTDCIVECPFMVKRNNVQPRQGMVYPPTAMILFLHG